MEMSILDVLTVLFQDSNGGFMTHSRRLWVSVPLVVNRVVQKFSPRPGVFVFGVLRGGVLVVRGGVDFWASSLYSSIPLFSPVGRLSGVQ